MKKLIDIFLKKKVGWEEGIDVGGFLMKKHLLNIRYCFVDGLGRFKEKC